MKKLLLSLTALMAVSGAALAHPALSTIMRIHGDRDVDRRQDERVPVVPYYAPAYRPVASYGVSYGWEAPYFYTRDVVWERWHRWHEWREHRFGDRDDRV